MFFKFLVVVTEYGIQYEETFINTDRIRSIGNAKLIDSVDVSIVKLDQNQHFYVLGKASQIVNELNKLLGRETSF